MEQTPEKVLPRLRMNLDVMASPVEERPGLLMRDPHQYSDVTLIIPPPLVPLLEFFNGSSTELDLRQALVRMTGDLRVGDLEKHLMESLSKAGFLEDAVYDEMREQRHREFAEAPVRAAAHAGTAYPEDPAQIREAFSEYFAGAAGERNPVEALDGWADRLIGIAAPHVSPEGGWESYADAYRVLGPQNQDRIFVVLGTSHFGAPERFGLTRKNYVTPVGESRTETALVDRLAVAGREAVAMEDYCHANEHSIEFQVAFLQHVYGAGVRVLPILCGPFAKSLYEGGAPEEDEGVHRFLDALGELQAREGKRLMWVLGIDMAHIGRRYGDRMTALADQGEMLGIAERDRERIERIEAGDARGFWELVQPNHDDLKWCGSSPLYTFLRAVPEAKARMLRYQQWQIDPQSVVSFAAMAFASAG